MVFVDVKLLHAVMCCQSHGVRLRYVGLLQLQFFKFLQPPFTYRALSVRGKGTRAACNILEAQVAGAAPSISTILHCWGHPLPPLHAGRPGVFQQAKQTIGHTPHHWGSEADGSATILTVKA